MRYTIYNSKTYSDLKYKEMMSLFNRNTQATIVDARMIFVIRRAWFIRTCKT